MEANEASHPHRSLYCVQGTEPRVCFFHRNGALRSAEVDMRLASKVYLNSRPMMYVSPRRYDSQGIDRVHRTSNLREGNSERAACVRKGMESRPVRCDCSVGDVRRCSS